MLLDHLLLPVPGARQLEAEVEHQAVPVEAREVLQEEQAGAAEEYRSRLQELELAAGAAVVEQH